MPVTVDMVNTCLPKDMSLSLMESGKMGGNEKGWPDKGGDGMQPGQ